MNPSIPILAETCHNGRTVARRPSLGKLRVRRMTGSRPINKAAPDLEPDTARQLLVVVAQTRNVDAFETLFRFYAPRVRSFMMIKVRDRQVAEELMQETMASVWSKAVQFDPERGQVSAWVFTIARNVRIDFYRRRRPQFDVNDPVFVVDTSPPADEEFEHMQDAKLLREAMATLPQEQIEVLQKAFFDDVSHSTIADELGLPIGTVKSRIRLAFAKLRSALEGRR